ncbi:hypothetical protein [Rossellomorea vietnamensis]|uniref:hypothetical protein n=1 Tax=Rossellomorea vietnamensis TaxID=218284 RepID=UPI00077CB3F7|nr:hypothetical protein [Rossellomorea vietnamensis]
MEQTVWIKDEMVDHEVFRNPADLRVYMWILLRAGQDGTYIHRNGRMLRDMSESMWYYNGKKLDWYSIEWIKECLKRLEGYGLIRVDENGFVVTYGEGEGPPSQ